MENLQNTITKTDTLKNDLKLAKQKINDKIISGGGTIADTISGVPERIDKMLGNYKKVAIINNRHTLLPGGYFDSKLSMWVITVPLNLDFTPSRIIMHYNSWEGSSTAQCLMDSKYHDRNGNSNANLATNWGWFINKSKENFTIAMYSRLANARTTEVIAIE